MYPSLTLSCFPSHIDSEHQDLDHREITDGNGRTLKFWISEVNISKPMVPERDTHSLDRYVYPSEVCVRVCTLVR